MGVSGQGDNSPLLFEVEGTPFVLSPYFFGGRHFCTNAHGIHWMIETVFVKFSHLILMKIIKIVTTRCQILRLNAPNSTVLLHDPWLDLRGLLLRGEEGVEGGEGSPLLFSAELRP